MNIEKEIIEFVTGVINRAETKKASSRERAMAHELITSLDDYYQYLQDQITDGNIEFSDAVVVEVNGTKLKFSNIDEVAEWMTAQY
jgi:phosphoribulokinase